MSKSSYMRHSAKLIFLILFLTNVDIAKTQTYLGFGGGMNFSKVRYDNDTSNSYLKEFQHFEKGFNAGLFSTIYFGKVLSVRSDLEYTQKGFQYTSTYRGEYKKFNYAEISTSGALDLNYDGDIVITPFIGYWLAYWMSGTRGIFDIKNKIYQTDKIYLNSDTTFAYNRWDTGLSCGLEFRYKPTKKTLLTIGTKYEYGLMSSSKNKTDGWKNRNILIFLAYNFKL